MQNPCDTIFCMKTNVFLICVSVLLRWLLLSKIAFCAKDLIISLRSGFSHCINAGSSLEMFFGRTLLVNIRKPRRKHISCSQLLTKKRPHQERFNGNHSCFCKYQFFRNIEKEKLSSRTSKSLLFSLTTKGIKP